MKVLLIGANGQLGTDLHAVLKQRGVDVRPVIEPEIDVRSKASVDAIVGSTLPDVVINTAAFHQVEYCEEQPTLAFEVNALGVRHLAMASARYGAALVHFSTDYVFDGSKPTPYVESDLPTPLNVYGATKLAGEHMLACVTARYYLIRTCGLYGLAGPYGKKCNFVERVLVQAGKGVTMRIVNDQILSPTCTVDLAEKVVDLISTNAYGLYHLSSEGQCSWYEFACAVAELTGVKPMPSPCATADFASTARRPSYSVMSKAKFNALRLGTMPLWRDALERYLRSRVQPLGAATA